MENFQGRKPLWILQFCGFLQKFSPWILGVWHSLVRHKWANRESFLPWKFPAIRYPGSPLLISVYTFPIAPNFPQYFYEFVINLGITKILFTNWKSWGALLVRSLKDGWDNKILITKIYFNANLEWFTNFWTTKLCFIGGRCYHWWRVWLLNNDVINLQSHWWMMMSLLCYQDLVAYKHRNKVL